MSDKKKRPSVVMPTMHALEALQCTRDMLDRLETHITNVGRAWTEIQEKCPHISVMVDDHLFWMLHGAVEGHDMSKFDAEEFTQYRRKWNPTSYEEAVPVEEFDNAWKHHWENNDHHWQNWTRLDTKDQGQYYKAVVACTHMVVDWLAMSYEFGDTPRAYYEKNKETIKLPEWAVEYITEIFDLLESTPTRAGRYKLMNTNIELEQFMSLVGEHKILGSLGRCAALAKQYDVAVVRCSMVDKTHVDVVCKLFNGSKDFGYVLENELLSRHSSNMLSASFESQLAEPRIATDAEDKEIEDNG